MAEILTCPGCKTTNVKATFICNPCNNPAGTGQTVWTMTPSAPNTGVPMRARCPGCLTERMPALVTCLQCGKTFVPDADSTVTARGEGTTQPPTAEEARAGERASTEL